MSHHSDHPLLRRELSCPICEMGKRPGLTMCWPCNMTLDDAGELESSEIEDRLDAAEAKLELELLTGAM